MSITDDAPLYGKDVSSILYDRVGAYATSADTVSDAVTKQLTWTSLVNHDPLEIIGNNGRSTIAVPQDGLWSITATCTNGGGSTAARSYIRIFVGSPISSYFPSYLNGGEDRISTTAIVPMSAGDEFLVEVYYDMSGASSDVSAWLLLYKIGV